MVCRRVGTDLVRSDPLQRPVSESGQSTDLHAVLEIYHSLCEIERIKSAKRVSRGVVLVARGLDSFGGGGGVFAFAYLSLHKT